MAANARACPLLSHRAHPLSEAAKIGPRDGGKENLLWGLVPATLLDQRHCTTGVRGFHQGHVLAVPSGQTMAGAGSSGCPQHPRRGSDLKLQVFLCLVP